MDYPSRPCAGYVDHCIVSSSHDTRSGKYLLLADGYEPQILYAGVGPTTNHVSDVAGEPEFDVEEDLEGCKHGYRDG
jgi:hypothetical protein